MKQADECNQEWSGYSQLNQEDEQEQKNSPYGNHIYQ